MFYKKPMAPKISILNRSAITETCKFSTASQELIRRLKNCSTLLAREMVETVLVDFMDELSAAGYGVDWRERVLASALLGYERILDKERRGTCSRNRSGATTFKSRRAKRLAGAKTWFQDKDKEEPVHNTNAGPHRRPGPPPHKKEKHLYESICFVPLTKNSTLRKRLTKVEDGLNQPSRVKFIEEMGQTLASLVVRKDTCSGQKCGRQNCLPCETQPGKCLRQGALYFLQCTTRRAST